MALLTLENKVRINQAIAMGKNVVHWAWIPTILYLGLRASNPRPSLIRLISPLA